jgi:vacuolar-type H+-ATPase subunit H
MSKNLKEIFESGRKRLNDLAEKRKELLERCAVLKQGAESQRLEETSRRLTSLEEATTLEISAQLETAQEMHRQSLSQIIKDNERHLSDVKQELEFRVSRLTKELVYLQQWSAELTSDNADQSLRPLELKIRSIMAEHKTSVTAGLNELDGEARKVQRTLAEERDQVTSKINDHIKEAKDKLVSAASEVTKQLQEQSAELDKQLSTDKQEQLKLTEESCAKIEAGLAEIKKSNIEAIELLSKNVESELLTVSEQVVVESGSQMTQLADECSASLVDAAKTNQTQLELKLAEMEQQIDESVELLKKLLLEANERAKEHADKVETAAKQTFDESLKKNTLEQSGNDSDKAVLDEMSNDLQKMSAQLVKQLNNTLNLYTDRVGSLLISSDKNMSGSLDSIKVDLERMLDTQKNVFREKEQLLTARLDALERKYSRILAGISDEA